MDDKVLFAQGEVDMIYIMERKSENINLRSQRVLCVFVGWGRQTNNLVPEDVIKAALNIDI